MKNKLPYFSGNYHNGLQIFLSFISIFFGGIIYLFLRPKESVFFNFFSLVGLDDWTVLLRANTIPIGRYLPSWFVYSLPNGLWAFAYAMLIFIIWKGSKSGVKYFWFTTIPLLVVGFEMLQYAELIQGTFCSQDIIFGLLGIGFGILVNFKIIKPKYHEKFFT